MRIDFDKLTKGVLAVSLLLVAFSFFYYYVIFLPQKEEARLEQQKQEQLAKVFSSELKCQTLLKDLKKRWNNVVGIYYSEKQNTCIVRYTKDGETKEAPIERMRDTE